MKSADFSCVYNFFCVILQRKIIKRQLMAKQITSLVPTGASEHIGKEKNPPMA